MRSSLSFLLISLLSTPIFTRAQAVLNFFSDSARTGNHNRALVTLHENEFIYVGGQSFDGNETAVPAAPSVVKLDTAGNTVWSYSLSKEVDEQIGDNGTSYGNGAIVRLQIDSSAVYAHFSRSSLGTNEIWKLDKATGNLLWKRTVPEIMFMINVNSNELAITYNANGKYNYDLINKTTGRPVFATKQLGPEINYLEHAFIASDAEGSVYITRNDTITKYTSSTLNTVGWHKQAINDGYITSVVASDDGSVYFFGNRYTVFYEPVIFGRASKSDGSIIWLAQPPANAFFSDEVINDARITGNYVYASSIHTLYGSVYTAYHLWKFNRSTGTYIWDKTYHPLWGSGAGQPGSPYAGALSFDVDANDNVYVTGYEGSGDTRLGQWGICKFNRDGGLVYHQAIFNGDPYASHYSRGVLSYFYNNRVYYVGELQKASDKPGSYVYLASTDTGSVFALSRLKKTESRYQEPSAVKKIIPFSNTKYVVYSQLGDGVRITLKSSRNGTTIWQKDILRPAYLKADKMAVTADRKILISCTRHESAEMQFDYINRPDSLYFIKFDSLGTITSEFRHDVSGMVNLNPIQLYAGGDSNNVYVYSMVDYYNNENSIHFFNVDKSQTPLGAFSNYISSLNISLQGRQDLLVPRSRDSAIFIANTFPTNNMAIFQVYKFNSSPAYTSGYERVVQTPLNQQLVVQNLLKFDDSSIVFSGKAKIATSSQIARYSFGNRLLLWIRTLASGRSVEGISSSSNSIYYCGENYSSLIISRLNATNGATQWEKVIAPSLPNQFYVPLDQQYNAVRHEYTVCGFIEDRTNITYSQEAFYITVDTSGNIIKQWIQSGDYNKNNQLNTIAISQFGQTLLGGALYKKPYGLSAVLIEADTIAKTTMEPQTPVITISPSSAVCYGDTLTLTASSPDCNGCTFQWDDSFHTTGQVLKVTASGSYHVTVSNSSGSAVAGEVVTVKPLPPKPTITVSGDSLRSSAATGNQWYLNGAPLPNDTTQFLHATVSGTYQVRVTQDACTGPMSEGFSFTITGIFDPTAFEGQVRVLPNPVLDRIVTINDLDHAVDVKLYDITGKLLLGTHVPLRSTKALFVSRLNRGIYIVVVVDSKTKKNYRKTIVKQ